MRLLLRPERRHSKSRVGAMILFGSLLLGSLAAVFFWIFPSDEFFHIDDKNHAGENVETRDAEKNVETNVPVPSPLPPWGYHAKRNVPRLNAIAKEIHRDGEESFSLVDYGSDQGYFSISLAHAFPSATIFSVEMGGKGGDIYRKEKGDDVIDVQRRMAEKFHTPNVHICRAKIDDTHFGEMFARGVRMRYQLVLSVFHWMSMDTREAFEKVLSELLRGARTTFLELPLMGNDPVLGRQVGAERVRRWYGGRENLKDVILDTAKARHIDGVSVREIAAVPWLKWKRRVYRVDVEEGGRGTGGFPCVALQRVLKCEDQHPFC